MKKIVLPIIAALLLIVAGTSGYFIGVQHGKSAEQTAMKKQMSSHKFGNGQTPPGMNGGTPPYGMPQQSGTTSSTTTSSSN